MNPTSEHMDALLETLHQHTECFNAVCAHGWQHREKNGVRLHLRTYYPLRDRFPDLPSQLVIAARVRATSALKSALTRLRKGKKASCPHSTLSPIRYDARTYALKRDVGIVSLSSVAGPLKVPFITPNEFSRSQP